MRCHGNNRNIEESTKPHRTATQVAAVVWISHVVHDNGDRVHAIHLYLGLSRKLKKGESTTEKEKKRVFRRCKMENAKNSSSNQITDFQRNASQDSCKKFQELLLNGQENEGMFLAAIRTKNRHVHFVISSHLISMLDFHLLDPPRASADFRVQIVNILSSQQHRDGSYQ
jgi:hypothetical protein